MSEQTGGSQQLNGYRLVRQQGKWQEPVYVEGLTLCGDYQPVPADQPWPVAK